MHADTRTCNGDPGSYERRMNGPEGSSDGKVNDGERDVRGTGWPAEPGCDQLAPSAPGVRSGVYGRVARQLRDNGAEVRVWRPASWWAVGLLATIIAFIVFVLATGVGEAGSAVSR